MVAQLSLCILRQLTRAVHLAGYINFCSCDIKCIKSYSNCILQVLAKAQEEMILFRNHGISVMGEFIFFCLYKSNTFSACQLFAQCNGLNRDLPYNDNRSRLLKKTLSDYRLLHDRINGMLLLSWFLISFDLLLHNEYFVVFCRDEPQVCRVHEHFE